VIFFGFFEPFSKTGRYIKMCPAIVIERPTKLTEYVFLISSTVFAIFLKNCFRKIYQAIRSLSGARVFKNI